MAIFRTSSYQKLVQIRRSGAAVQVWAFGCRPSATGGRPTLLEHWSGLRSVLRAECRSCTSGNSCTHARYWVACGACPFSGAVSLSRLGLPSLRRTVALLRRLGSSAISVSQTMILLFGTRLRTISLPVFLLISLGSQSSVSGCLFGIPIFRV